jgi:ABC-2 type transport system permease protein
MRNVVGLYFRLIGAQLRGKLQYRLGFIMETSGYFLITFLDFIIIAVILSRFKEMGGWNLYEVAFLYALTSISFTIAEMVSRGFDRFAFYIQTGELDRVLVRPVSPYLQIISLELPLQKVGRLGQGIVVLFISLGGINVQWDLVKILLATMAIASGAIVYIGIFIIGAVTTIWTVSTSEFINIFTNGGTVLSSYPLNIYQEWFRHIFTFIIPMAFLNFFPALLILDKPAIGGLPLWLGWLGLPTAFAFLGVSLLIWRWGLKKYQSTGT